MENDKVIVAIELGSSKISGIAGQILFDGSLKVLAYAGVPSSSCIRHGAVYNLEKTGNAIVDVINRLEATLSTHIQKVYVGYNAKISGNVFANVKNAKITGFEGPHPAGNAGVQISHVCPVNKGEMVIVVNPQDVVIVGRLAKNGIYDAKKTIALAGGKVKNPAYFTTVANAKIDGIISGNYDTEDARIIGGNVLTGTKLSADGYLGFYDNEISIIPEGNYYDFFGWALPGLKKYSFSHTFFSWLCPKKQYNLDTNMHGEKRAYVVTGTFEKLVPMDILPLQLIKAILAENIELMEELGIYEVAEEDFALCEFADTSKSDIQAIIRKGLDLMVQETM